MPAMASCSWLNRTPPPSSASITSSDQRSPTFWTAAANGEFSAGIGSSVVLQAARVTGRLQATSLGVTDQPTGVEMDVLSHIAESTTAVAEKTGSAVVAIGRNSRGAGVVVAPGAVVTNAHNLRDRTTQVTFHDGRTEQATVQGVDVDGDLAVLSVDTADIEPLQWAGSGDVKVGTPVFGLARRGGNGLRTTFGTVSATDQTFRGPRGRRVGGAFEHTAPLGRGSSGGPVTDLEGRLLGINTSRLGHGFYLAVPADADLRRRLDELAAGQSRERPRLGVGLAPSSVANRLRRSVGLPERDGLLVQAVVPGESGERAGLQIGDLIVAVGDRDVARVDDLMSALDAQTADSVLTLTVVHGTEERTVAVRFDGSTATEGAA
ncbi:MAG: PDZ domain-containing protein [Nitriliruptorales bacterium]|nr:PDZ domain-containing protein [Nitriliruptorales bacterium]